jgi:hypothetical protein
LFEIESIVHYSAIARKRNKSQPNSRETFMASLLTRHWLDANIIVPTEDCTIITQLVQRAVREGHAVTTLAALQEYALTINVDDAEASFVQSLKEKSRAIEAATAAAAEEDAARATKLAADAKLAAVRHVAAAKERAAKEAEARRAATEAAATEETESETDDEAEWADFWAGTEASLRGDVRETAGGYDVVLRGAGDLEVSVEGGKLRVAGVRVPSPSVQDKIMALAKRRALRLGHASVTEEDVLTVAKGRFGAVDEVVCLPANADVKRATREARGRDLLVRVPRRAPPRRVRRAVDPYHGRALFREPSYPPIYSY